MLMPTVEQIEWFLKTGSMYGLGWVLLAGLVFVLLYGALFGTRSVLGIFNDIRTKWLPQLVSGHLSFLENTKVANTTTATAVEKLTESYGASMGNHDKTHKALAHITKAMHDDTTCDEVKKELQRAINILEPK